MSVKVLLINPSHRQAFEDAACALGYRNFTRNGQFYAVSDLNLVLQGYLIGNPQAQASWVSKVCRVAEQEVTV